MSLEHLLLSRHPSLSLSRFEKRLSTQASQARVWLPKPQNLTPHTPRAGGQNIALDHLLPPNNAAPLPPPPPRIRILLFPIPVPIFVRIGGCAGGPCRGRTVRNPKPKNPKPEMGLDAPSTEGLTPNPKPQTLHPTPQTPNLTPQTPNPKPYTPHPTPQIPNPKAQTGAGVYKP